MKDYSFSYFLATIFSYILTKLAFPNARLIRHPVYIRGKKGIVYGKGLTTGHGCRIDASNDKVTLRIGINARFGDYLHINADYKVVIGDNILTASKVFISDTNHGVYKGKCQSNPNSNPSDRELVNDPVVIGDNVWIGENVVILPGSKIGNGCVIGANTLVNGGNYPDGTMLVGNPARIIKKYSEGTQQWESINRFVGIANGL